MLILPDFECALCGHTKPPIEMEFVPSELGGPTIVCQGCVEEVRIAVTVTIDECLAAGTKNP